METALLEQKTDMQTSKKCPFCAEQIQAEAIKCRFCGEFFENRRPTASSKWYFATSAVVMAALCVGPFALPLVWLNPRYRIVPKLLITAAIIGLTLGLSYVTMNMYMKITEQIRALGIG